MTNQLTNYLEVISDLLAQERRGDYGDRNSFFSGTFGDDEELAKNAVVDSLVHNLV